jgi:hypothetical protein
VIREREELHESRRAAPRGIDGNGGNGAHWDDLANALSRDRFFKRRWQLEMLYHYWNSKSMLSRARWSGRNPLSE